MVKEPAGEKTKQSSCFTLGFLWAWAMLLRNHCLHQSKTHKWIRMLWWCIASEVWSTHFNFFPFSLNHEEYSFSKRSSDHFSALNSFWQHIWYFLTNHSFRLSVFFQNIQSTSSRSLTQTTWTEPQYSVPIFQHSLNKNTFWVIVPGTNYVA